MERLQRKISRLYFHHGQFCASHSVPIILAVIFIILLFCYPLTYVSLPKNAPFDYSAISEADFRDSNMTARYMQNTSHTLGYVVQIIMRVTVSPWEQDRMRPLDALRAPLLHAFQLDRLLVEFRCRDTGRSLSDVCLQVAEASPVPLMGGGVGSGGADGGPGVTLPSFTCLHTSPANFWDGDETRFQADPHLFNTMKTLGKNNIREILFGLPWKSTGLSGFFIRSRQRVITFAATIVLKEYDKIFLTSLRQRLLEAYPLSKNITRLDQAKMNMIFYKEKNYFSDYMPLGITYIVLLLYVYFSVRKIEMVKSKWGLAISACFTVVSSLLMSIGICVYIGLTPTLNGSEIFPYLVVLIGLENVLVITKSVVATPVDLPVKDRIAQGLAKEGWAITKNLVTELGLLAVGFFTFNPAIQEFCLFAVVGLTTDFFLQMFFFVTVLSIDIRRMELCDLHSFQPGLSPPTPVPVDPFFSTTPPVLAAQAVSKPSDFIRGHKRKASDLNTAAFIQSNGQVPVYVPRRLRFLYYWAKTRVFQRVLMVVLACWIVVIVYTTGFYRPIITLLLDFLPSTAAGHQPYLPTQDELPLDSAVSQSDSSTPEVLLPVQDTWKVMAYYHWPVLSRYYNLSLSGHHLTVLPPIHLAHIIAPQEALNVRYGDDSVGNGEANEAGLFDATEGLLPRSFSGWADLWLTTGMIVTCLVGVTLVLTTTYFVMCLFQWMQARGRNRRTKVIRILPLVIDACCHGEDEVDLIATGAGHLATVNLTRSDQVTVWRLDSGDLVAKINRSSRNEETNLIPFNGKTSSVWCMAMSKGILLLGCSDGKIECWDFVTAGFLSSTQLDSSGVTKLSLSDNSLYTISYNGYLSELNLQNTSVTLRRSVKAHHHPITDFYVYETGIATVSEDCMVKLFFPGSLALKTTIHSADDAVLCVHVSKHLIVFGTSSGTVHLTELDPTSTDYRFHHTASVIWVRSIHEDRVLSCDLEGRVCLWKNRRESPLFHCQLSDQSFLLSSPVCLLANWFLYGEKNTIRVVNLDTYHCSKSLVLLSPNGTNTFSNITPVCVSEDRHYIISMATNKIILLPASVVR